MLQVSDARQASWQIDMAHNPCDMKSIGNAREETCNTL